MKFSKNTIEICTQSETPYKDEFDCVEENVWEWKRYFYIQKNKASKKGLSMKLKCKFLPDFYMMPGINYNGNRWGNGKEPKGSEWCFAYHRMGIPAAMYVQSEQISVAFFAKDIPEYGCSAQIQCTADGACMELIIPEKEIPDVYCARDQYEGRCFECNRDILKGEIVEMSAFIIVHRWEKKQQNYDYGFFLRKAWNIYSEELSYDSPGLDVWKIGICFVRRNLFLRKECFSGFCMGLEWKNGEWVQNTDRLEIGWVGQNASLAVSLLYDAYFYKCRDSLNMGLEVLDVWVEYASLKNGLFRCRFDQLMTQANIDNKAEENDAANLYSVVAEYLDAFHILKTMKIDREKYREIALDVCDFICEKQSDNGKFGKAWYNDGTSSDTEGGIGCYLSEALLYGWRETKNPVYLEKAKKGFQYYYEEFCRYGYTTAGALDTYCIDKESAMPLLRCAVMLYDFCGKEIYLEAACQVSDYLASWQYHYNVPYGKDSVLGQIQYKTKGGMSVSVQHHHIDCYGLEICNAWKRLSEQTGDLIWKERAEAIWMNSLQNISDGELVIKGQKRPAGNQDEGFLQTRWHTKRGEYFGVSEWLVAWSTAFRLKILREEKYSMKNGGKITYED